MATSQVTEQVAEHIEDIADATRQIREISPAGWFTSGVLFGFGLGFFYGYRYNRKKIRAEILAQADKEIEIIRDTYQQKAEAAQAAAAARAKPASPEDVIEERGYSRVEQEDPRPTRPPVPVQEPLATTPPPGPTVSYHSPGASGGNTAKHKDYGWDFPKELAGRSEDRPYIIHQDEYSENGSGYRQATYTYYAIDGVLTNVDDVKLDQVDEIFGMENFARFGHGADDFDVLFIRNDEHQLEAEICRVHKSYEEEVQGLDRSDS